MLELLSPAGSPEAVTAAVQNGADAVYLSFDDLNDCRTAVNFSDNGFEAAVRYCRVRDCKVYLAINTVIRAEEMPKAAGLAMRGQRAGVDAVIVRDLGLFAVLRRLLPEMPLFADHRLGFYTPESAAIAAAMGFKRIFLPPEMPLEQIRRMTAADVETAVFVQTSLCPSAAGQCRMSALSGRGSADRGQCDCPCRESYTLGGRWDTTPLSWKDRCMIPQIEQLAEAGVDCVCIGDRERRAEYTAAYTAVCREAIRENQQPAAPDREAMEKVFIPRGVTSGTVYEPAVPEEPLDPRAIEHYCAEIRRGYTEGELRRVGVRFAVVCQSETQAIHLGAQDGEKHQTIIEGPMPDPMGDMELTEETLRDAMYRTAGTPFRCEDVECVLAEGLRVSALELDAARRRLLYKLSEERSQPPKRKEGVYPAEPFPASRPVLPVINFAFRTAEQMLPELAALRPGCVYVPLEICADEPDALRPFVEAGAEIVAALPCVVSGEEEEARVRALLSRARANGVERALTGNLGLALMAGQEDMKLRGDLELAAANDHALQSLSAAGFLSAVVSPELTLEQIRALNKPMDTELLVYGRVRVMTTQTNLLKQSAGRNAYPAVGQMADTHGGVWPVTKDFGERNAVWLKGKLWLADMTDDWIQCGLWAVRLNFSTESPRECLDVANAYILGTAYRPNGMTRGLYYRGTL